MKKITKYLVFSFLMVASIIATASVTYAYSGEYTDMIQFNVNIEDGDGGHNLDSSSYEFLYQYKDFIKSVEFSNETGNLDLVGISSFSSSMIEIETTSPAFLYVTKTGDTHDYGENYLEGSATVTIYLNIDSSPVLDGQTAFVTTIDDPITVAEITSYISAYDETDGSLTHQIELVDSARDFLIFTVQMVIDQGGNVTQDMSYLLAEYDAGSLDEDVAGSPLSNAIIDNMYTSMYVPQAYSDSITDLTPDGEDSYVLVYYVSDTAGNYSVLEVSVYVKDVLSPETTDKTASVSYADTFNLSNYLSTQAKDMFADNYDSDEDLTIVIQNDDYTTNKTVVGDHVVQFKATDTSGNVSYAELTISVYDDVDPVFSGPASITKATTETLTLSEIKAMLSANDVVDGSLTSSIQVVTDDFTGRGNLVGSYDIQFSVVDSAGNIAYHTVTVNVVDDIPPVFYVKDGYFISVSSVVELTVQDIIDILEITGQISVDGSGGITVTTLTDEYTGNQNTAGIYAMSFNVKAVNGEESIYSVAIEVVDDNDDGLVIDDEDDSTLLDDIKQFFDNSKDFVVDNVYYVAGGIVVIILISAMLTTGKKKRYYR